LSILPSYSNSKPKLKRWNYADFAFVVSSPELKNIKNLLWGVGVVYLNRRISDTFISPSKSLSPLKLGQFMVEMLTIRFGSIENYYRIAIDKESHSNKKVTVTILYL
jgi:hypothetical protein